MTLWNFGNTTVRSPFRLRDGLLAIRDGGIEGRLYGADDEKYFIQAMADYGIIKTGNDTTYSIGRKWRSALTKHGFLTPNAKKKEDLPNFEKAFGKPGRITQNGRRLMESETVSGWQECFLRSIAGYMLPSYLEDKKTSHFSPLRFVLDVMVQTEAVTNDSYVSFTEMAGIIQCHTYDDDIKEVVNKIQFYREARILAKKKKSFDVDFLKNIASSIGVKHETLIDYSDLNIRYLKATGLFHAKGRGLRLSDEKSVLISQLRNQKIAYKSDIEYLVELGEGARLPFDSKEEALVVLHDLASRLKQKGQDFDFSHEKLDNPADIAIVRHKLEELFNQLNENNYAKEQSSQIEEILLYFDLLIKNKNSIETSDGAIIEIPSSERPAYFEWAVWRMFLALSSVVNPPWEARRFKVDQDFLPIGTAPGGGPDMIFEFDDMVLVVEVTLTASSRQEAAEGESVRRHVAKYAETFSESGKKVFGLFTAISIDTNTANTFRLGEWYLRDDKRIALQIVPIALVDLRRFIEAFSNDLPSVKNILKETMTDCLLLRSHDAPEWKTKISSTIEQCIKNSKKS